MMRSQPPSLALITIAFLIAVIAAMGTAWAITANQPQHNPTPAIVLIDHETNIIGACVEIGRKEYCATRTVSIETVGGL